MGEYVTAVIYKEMKPLSPFLTTFEKICWELYDAKGNREAIEQIYRKIGFVNSNGSIFDLMMRFLEKDGKVYQTNQGVLGVKELPNLSFYYKFHFPDIWMSLLRPNELAMNEYDVIEVELTGKTIHERFIEMEDANKNNPSFENSSIYQAYYVGKEGIPAIRYLFDYNDIIQLHVGHIYYTGDEHYRDQARKKITKQRKEIASQFKVPHWAKKTPY